MIEPFCACNSHIVVKLHDQHCPARVEPQRVHDRQVAARAVRYVYEWLAPDDVDTAAAQRLADRIERGECDEELGIR